jgi:hypothetical protein
MVITSDLVQKSSTNVGVLTKSANNTDDTNHDKSCNYVDCIFKPISKCTLCSWYYCYVHANEHAHSMDNLEILK